MRLPTATAAPLVLVAVLVAACSGGSGDGSGSGGGSGSDRTPTQSAGPGGSASPVPTTAPPVAPARVAGVVATGLAVPWGIAFLPGGSALVSERDTARIVHVTPQGDVTKVGTVQGVDGSGEGGLLGIALSPAYPTDRTLFAYYTAGPENVIARMTYDGSGLADQRRIFGGIPSGPIHNGGRIAFGPDGFLYVGTGEAGRGTPAQDPNDLGGKILRITPEGDPAPGNPTKGSPVWTLGHRNVQGLAWDARGRMWASEFGQNTWDELNLIHAGGNYGWPDVEGNSSDKRFVAPQRVWPTSDASPSGIAVAGGSVWMAGLRGERLWQIPLTGTGTGEPVAHFTGTYGRLRTVMLAPDGSLWLTTSNTDGRGDPRDGDDRILRLVVS
jgi:glucose/arabinose dehydrogenase